MSEISTSDASLKQLLDKMVAAKQMSAIDAKSLARQDPPGRGAAQLGAVGGGDVAQEDGVVERDLV